jgi:hypothetical protein
MARHQVQLSVLRDGELLFAQAVRPGHALTVGPAAGDVVPTTVLPSSLPLLVPTRAGYGLRLRAPLAGHVQAAGRRLRFEGGLLLDPRPEPLLLTDGDEGEVALDEHLRVRFTVHRLTRAFVVWPRCEPRLALCLAGACAVALAGILAVAPHAPPARAGAREVRLETRPAIVDLALRRRGPTVARHRRDARPTRPVATRSSPRRNPSRTDVLRRGVLGILDSPQTARSRRGRDATLGRALAALDRLALTSAATGPRGSSGGRGDGRDPLGAWLGRTTGDGDGLPLPRPALRREHPPGPRLALQSSTAGGPSREEIRSVVASGSAAVRLCYERELITSGQPREGRLLLEWTIGADGRVVAPTVRRDTIGSASLRACILQQVAGWVFPRCPKQCQVVYPFEFYSSVAAASRSSDPSQI